MLEVSVRRLVAVTADMVVTVVMEAMAEVTVPVVPVICAVTCGVRIRCVNVWEEICVHACK